MKLMVKFANKDVNIKKLVQGAVVLYYSDVDSTPDVYHIHKFQNLAGNNTIDLVIVDDFGKWEKNTENLHWPI